MICKDDTYMTPTNIPHENRTRKTSITVARSRTANGNLYNEEKSYTEMHEMMQKEK